MRTLFIDPSYKCCGMVLVEEDRREITFSCLIIPHDAMKSYLGYFNVALKYRNYFKDYLKLVKPDKLLIEYPFFMGHTTGGLFGLSFLLMEIIYDYFGKLIPDPSRFPIEFINPSFCKSNFKKVFPTYLAGKTGKVQHRSQAVLDLLPVLNGGMFVYNNMELLSETNAKEDVATAFLFWYFMDLDKRGLIEHGKPKKKKVKKEKLDV